MTRPSPSSWPRASCAISTRRTRGRWRRGPPPVLSGSTQRRQGLRGTADPRLLAVALCHRLRVQARPDCPRPLPRQDPDFHRCYVAVGDFPEVNVGPKWLLVRMLTHSAPASFPSSEGARMTLGCRFPRAAQHAQPQHRDRVAGHPSARPATIGCRPPCRWTSAPASPTASCMAARGGAGRDPGQQRRQPVRGYGQTDLRGAGDQRQPCTRVRSGTVTGTARTARRPQHPAGRSASRTSRAAWCISRLTLGWWRPATAEPRTAGDGSGTLVVFLPLILIGMLRPWGELRVGEATWGPKWSTGGRAG